MGLFSDCKQMVKYSGTSIEIATVKGPARVPVSIGGVAVKPQLLQTAGMILQILDWLQFTACQRIHALKKLRDISHETIADLILKQDDDSRMIAYLAILSITACDSPESFEKVLADWIAAALPRVKQNARRREYHDDSPASARARVGELQEELGRIEGETRALDGQIRSLKAELQDMKSRKRHLTEEKDELLHFFENYSMRMNLAEVGTLGLGPLERRVSEATEVFPYLSKAISENKPFSVKKSLKALKDQ